MLLSVFHENAMNRINHKRSANKRFCAAANNFRKLRCGPRANTCCHAPPRMDCSTTQLAYVRNERATRVVYVCSIYYCRLLSLCCRCDTAAVLLPLLLRVLLIGLFYFYCCYGVPGTFLLISTTAAVAVQTLVRFLLCWMLGS